MCNCKDGETSAEEKKEVSEPKRAIELKRKFELVDPESIIECPICNEFLSPPVYQVKLKSLLLLEVLASLLRTHQEENVLMWWECGSVRKWSYRMRGLSMEDECAGKFEMPNLPVRENEIFTMLGSGEDA